MMIPKPVRPPPVIWPRSLCVKPNWAPQSPRMPPRMENPTPAARMAMKPAQSSRLAFGAMASLLTCALLILRIWRVVVGREVESCRECDGREMSGRRVGTRVNGGAVSGVEASPLMLSGARAHGKGTIFLNRTPRRADKAGLLATHPGDEPSAPSFSPPARLA